jgi:hypothetical protein
VWLVRTDVSEEGIASIVRLIRIGKLRNLAVTTNRITLRRNTKEYLIILRSVIRLLTFLLRRFLSPWWWRRSVPPKRWFLQEQHVVTSQRRNSSTKIVLKQWNITYTPFSWLDVRFSQGLRGIRKETLSTNCNCCNFTRYTTVALFVERNYERNPLIFHKLRVFQNSVTGCWVYLEQSGMEWREDRENCTTRSFIICTLCQV